MENEERAVDSPEIKQLGSLVPSRNLFFIPFFLVEAASLLPPLRKKKKKSLLCNNLAIER